jgi:hypothetical protein
MRGEKTVTKYDGPPPEETVQSAIRMFQAGLRQDAAADYIVTGEVSLDWCPCCGINVRIEDQDGNYIAKWILTDSEARRFRSGLGRVLKERKWLMPSDTARQALQDRLEAATIGKEIPEKDGSGTAREAPSTQGERVRQRLSCGRPDSRRGSARPSAPLGGGSIEPDAEREPPPLGSVSDREGKSDGV